MSTRGSESSPAAANKLKRGSLSSAIAAKVEGLTEQAELKSQGASPIKQLTSKVSTTKLESSRTISVSRLDERKSEEVDVVKSEKDLDLQTGLRRESLSDLTKSEDNITSKTSSEKVKLNILQMILTLFSINFK